MPSFCRGKDSARNNSSVSQARKTNFIFLLPHIKDYLNLDSSTIFKLSIILYIEETWNGRIMAQECPLLVSGGAVSSQMVLLAAPQRTGVASTAAAAAAVVLI